MAVTVSLGDVFRVYVKPSLKGRLIFRKRTSRQKSARLEMRKDAVAKQKPAKKAWEACKRAGETEERIVYKKNKGYVRKEVCPMDKFEKYLRAAMKKVPAQSTKDQPVGTWEELAGFSEAAWEE